MKYYITTGISLRDHARCWKARDNTHDAKSLKEILQETDDPAEILQDFQHIRDRVIESMQSPDISVAAAKAVNEHFDENCWSDNRQHLLPAELNTLYMMQRDGRIFNRPGGHEVVFLCSESNKQEGAFCCAALDKLVTVNMAPRMTTRLRVLSHNWDPIRIKDFVAAIDEIDQTELARREDCEFVLTGGYKAVIIALVNKITLMALELGENQHWNTRIYHLHESSEELIEIPLIDGEMDIQVAL